MIMLYLVIVGLCFGSFIGAFHWRLHEGKNFTTDRSICEHCKHVLAWYDLIPLLSWLSLRGKCRYCKKSIGALAPLLELGTAAAFVGSYLAWPYELGSPAEILYFVLWLLMLVGLITLFVYDIRWFLLPDAIVFSLIGLGIIMRIAEVIIYDRAFTDVALGGALGLLVGGGLFYGLYQASKGKWIGGGDVKLGFLIGIVLGPFNAFLALLVAFYSASLLVIPLLLTKRITRKTKIPFGPFLIVGLLIAFLFSEPIRTWYTTNFGL